MEEVNQAPIAEVGGPYQGIEGIAINFDGSNSSDPEDDSLSYSWDFGDGNTATGVNPSHVYTVSGDYDVSLTVNDGTSDSQPSTTVANVSAAGTGAFIQSSDSNHLVVMEAENFDANESQGGRDWVEVTTPAGFVGDGAMQAQTECCVTRSADYRDNSPRLDFDVNFTQMGTHYIILRGRALNGAGNSVHAGLNGNEISSAANISFANVNDWVNSTSVRTINVPSAGVHTVNVWMREDGTYVDRILLTTNSSYSDSATGNELESPRDNGGFVNNPPVIAPISDQSNDLNDTISLAISANDADGDVLMYSATGLPADLGIDPITGAISGVATESRAFQVTVTVEDGNGGEDTETFNWAIGGGGAIIG